MLSTFDYETSARATIPASVQDEGKALVSGRLLADICRSLPSKPVHMAIDGAKVVLTCGQAKFTLQTMPVEEYPSLPGDARDHRLGEQRRLRPGGRARP